MYLAVEQGWTPTDHRLADIYDALVILAWQNTEDAQRKSPRNKPKPVPRPERPEAERDENAPVPLGMMTATLTTVSELMALREERANRWRARHGKKRKKGG